MRKDKTGRTQERVVSSVNLYLPLYGTTYAPPEVMEWERGVPEEVKSSPLYQMQAIAFFAHMMEDGSMHFPFNPIEQQPLKTGTIITHDTSDWGELDEEQFGERVKSFLDEAIMDFAVEYIDLALEVIDGIKNNELSDVDHVLVCYIVLIGNEGERLPRSSSIEARYSIFAAQGLIEVEEE